MLPDVLLCLQDRFVIELQTEQITLSIEQDYRNTIFVTCPIY